MYSPKSRMLFGMNKGYTLGEIYQFEPHYLEWLIRTIPSFSIDIHSFLQLPDPNPFDKYGKGNRDNSQVEYFNPPNEKLNLAKLGDIWHGYGSNSSLKAAKNFLQRGGIIHPVKYQFPNDILEINKQKTLGKFTGTGNVEAKYSKEYHELIAKDFICEN